MKKDRNSFFSEYGYNYNTSSMPNMMMPNQTVSANTNFYAGPANMNQNMAVDIDSRLSKIERQINRLETRVSKLEGSSINTTADDSYNYSNNMYMV